MSLTVYHAKLFAHELTKRSSSDNVDKLASALSDAPVDLNPHQIEAALFAFRSPLSKGAILEVGLGKTTEAGILLAQPPLADASHPGARLSQHRWSGEEPDRLFGALSGVVA
jgi:hypothetical protein